MNDQDVVANTKQIEIFAEDVLGIIYYFDKQNNVYKITDILEGKENPTIIGKYTKPGTNYLVELF